MQQKLVLGGVGVALILSLFSFFGDDGSSVKPDSFRAVPVLSSPLEVNGVATYYLAQKFLTATSTLSSIKTPAATTTGEVVCRLFTAASYATGFQLATASTYD